MTTLNPEMQLNCSARPASQLTPLPSSSQLDLQRLDGKFDFTIADLLMADLSNCLPICRLIRIRFQPIENTCKSQRVTISISMLLTAAPNLVAICDPQWQNWVDRPRRKKYDIVVHAIVPLSTVLLDPLSHLPWKVRHVHLQQLAVIAMFVDARPGSRIQLLVVEHFELRRECLEVWVELFKRVDGGFVGRLCGAGLGVWGKCCRVP